MLCRQIHSRKYVCSCSHRSRKKQENNRAGVISSSCRWVGMSKLDHPDWTRLFAQSVMLGRYRGYVPGEGRTEKRRASRTRRGEPNNGGTCARPVSACGMGWIGPLSLPWRKCVISAQLSFALQDDATESQRRCGQARSQHSGNDRPAGRYQIYRTYLGTVNNFRIIDVTQPVQPVTSQRGCGERWTGLHPGGQPVSAPHSSTHCSVRYIPPR
jgi:hypothetical protein